MNITYDYGTIQMPQDIPRLSLRHMHDVYEIIFFKSGNVSYVINGQRYTLKKNDIIFTRPMHYHLLEIQSNCPYERYNITFDEQSIGTVVLSRIPDYIDIVNCQKGSVIADNFARMEYYRKELPEESFREILRCLLVEILYNISMSTKNIIPIPSDISPILRDSLQYIDENFTDDISIEKICNALFISPSYFFKLFKKTLQLSPKQYINLKRLYYSQKRIRSGIKPTKVFSECGFDSYVGFYKQYVKTFGYPPSEESENL